MIKVYVKPDELWDYFQKHKKRFESAMDNVAEVLDDETESPLVRVYLTEENGYPSMTIEQVHGEDEEEVLVKECAISAKDCVAVYQKLLKQLEEYAAEIKSETTSGVDETDLELVAEREAELREALAVFLNTLMGFDESDEIVYDEEELSDMLDNIEMMMCQDFGYVAYRPQIIECNGQKKLVEFPYEESDPFGDED